MSTNAGSGRMQEQNFTDEELMKPAVVASLVGARGGDLGTGVVVRSTVVVRDAVAVPPLSAGERAEAQEAGIGGTATSLAVAASKVAEAANRPFEAKFSKLGFMLADPANAPRHAEQMAMMQAASPDELQKVLRISATQREERSSKEVRMRVDQWIANDPAVAARVADTSQGKTPAQNKEDLVREFGKLDFSKQRSLSMKDGQPVTNSPEDKRMIGALSRGYNAIDARLRSMGISPLVNKQGNSVSRTNATVDRIDQVAAGGARNKRMRDGVEIG